MKVVLIQQDIVWGDPDANHKRLDKVMVPGADMYVLPEMFSTGFAVEPQGIAEEAPSKSLDWMKAKASELDAAIVGSVALHEDGKYYNRTFFVKPDGSVCVYDKHHLFTYGGEDRYFTPGDKRTVVEFRGVRFLLLTCYDIRFPMWCRNRGNYDALICIASWPVRRQDNFDILLRARAVENQCYAIGVNRVGVDATPLTYVGGTALIDPYGKEAAVCVKGEETACSGEIDMNDLLGFREHFPVLRDADKY